MIAIYATQVEDLITREFAAEIATFKSELKSNLEKFILDDPLDKVVTITESWQKDYINKIISVNDRIITAPTLELQTLKLTFEGIPNAQDIGLTKYKPFRDKLISKMGYSLRRSDFYPKYFKKLGIKACVYCNSQLTVSVDSEDLNEKPPIAIIKAKFQVDHFLAKSLYPCFSVSLYNLYPVCGTCNNVKRASKINFKLYNEDSTTPNSSDYEFLLEYGCAAKYLIDFDQEQIKLKFIDPEEGFTNSLNGTFDISGIYDTQIDLAEEIILKAHIYNDAYKERLSKDFPKLFNHSNLSNRVMLGAYINEEDIHKRPMTKFIQDIAKQLGLI